MARQKLILVHGGQGCGKSSITNALREKMTHTTLMRLAGVPKQEEANLYSLKYHMSMLEAVNQSYGSGMNFVFDWQPHTFDYIESEKCINCYVALCHSQSVSKMAVH